MGRNRMLLIDLTQGDNPVVSYAKKRKDITKDVAKCEDKGEQRMLVRRRQRCATNKRGNRENVKPQQQDQGIEKSTENP